MEVADGQGGERLHPGDMKCGAPCRGGQCDCRQTCPPMFPGRPWLNPRAPWVCLGAGKGIERKDEVARAGTARYQLLTPTCVGTGLWVGG